MRKMVSKKKRKTYGTDYTRKNAQVVTSLKTSCYKSVHKLSTSCVRTACPKLSTSLERGWLNGVGGCVVRRGSCVVGRASWVVRRGSCGSCVVGRASWVVGTVLGVV